MKQEHGEAMRERQRAFVRQTHHQATARDIAQLRWGSLQEESVGRLRLSHLKEYPEEALVRKILEWIKAPADSAALNQTLQDIGSEDDYRNHAGVVALRKILIQEPQKHTQYIIDSNAIARLIALAQRDARPHLQLEASWCLANLLNGSTDQTAFLVRKNLIPVFIDVARNKYHQVAEQAIWGLGNVAADCLEFRQLVVNAGGIPVLCEVFDRADQELRSYIVWALSNICKNSPQHEPNTKVEDALTRMVRFVGEGQATGLEDLSNCLSGICQRVNRSNADVLNDAAFIQQLRGFYTLSLQRADCEDLLSQIHEVFGALTSGPDEFADHLMDPALFEGFRQLLCGGAPTRLKKELCWVLANFALCEQRHVLFLLSAAGVFDAVIALAFHDEQELAKEALFIACNLSKVKNLETLQHILASGLLDIYARALRDCQDERLVLVLEALFQLLKTSEAAGGGAPPLTHRLIALGIADLVEAHQRSPDDWVYFKARVLLEKFFVLEQPGA